MGSTLKVVGFVAAALVAFVVPAFGGGDARAAADPVVLASAAADADGSASSRERGKELGNGVRCTFNSDCESGHCAFKVCKAKSGGRKQLSNGASCTFNSDCASGHCAFKVCKAKSGGGGKQLGNGMACKFNSDCASNKCTFKVCKR
ncbi:MAG: hypothetical protein JNL38_29735 [Myxococcales bacterium]|jgi:hypothetical protein|nr:hypothetical protein [Myxococcales bacterium]